MLPLILGGRKPDRAWLGELDSLAGDRRPAGASSRRAVWRPAAAGGDGPGSRHAPRPDVRGRADRQPRLQVGDGAAHPDPAGRRRVPPDGGHGHPRSACRRVRRPGAVPWPTAALSGSCPPPPPTGSSTRYASWGRRRRRPRLESRRPTMWLVHEGRRRAPAAVRADPAGGAARRRVHRRHLRPHRHHQLHVQRAVQPDLPGDRRRGPGHPALQPRHQLHQPAPADRRQPGHHGGPGARRARRWPSTSRATPSSSGENGKPIGTASNGPPTLGAAWTDVTALNPLRLLPGGQPPRTNSQVVIDKHSADVGHFKVGDKVARPHQAASGHLHHHRHRDLGQRGQPARRDHHRVRLRPPPPRCSPARQGRRR